MKRNKHKRAGRRSYHGPEYRIVGEDELAPAMNAHRILYGLPGGDVYLSRDVEAGLRDELHLTRIAAVRTWSIGGLIAAAQHGAFGLPAPAWDIVAEREKVREERAAASGLAVAKRKRGKR